MQRKQTVLITGAAGFIGSHSAEALLAQDYKVVGVDNFHRYYDRSWKEQNLKCVGPDLAVEELDVCDEGAINRLIGQVRPTVILHLAAMAGVRPSIDDPALYARVNVSGTTNLLQAAVQHGVKKFVFASSSSVYGNAPKVPFAETDDVNAPVSPYAATKRAGELLCHTFWHLHKLPCFCLRFFTVYGPRQRPDLAIHKFARLILNNKPIPFYGDGSTSRDYTFVEDIVSGIMAAVDKCDRYRIYNLGGSDPVSLATLVAEIEKALGKKAIIDRRPMQAGDVERTYADLSRSRAELGFSPKTALPDGLRRFVSWLKEYGSVYKLPGEEPAAVAAAGA